MVDGKKNVMGWKAIKLTEPIGYERLHPRYGWAEFTLCVVRGRTGKIRKVFVQRSQQGVVGSYVLDVAREKLTNLHMGSHQASFPGITDSCYCADHRCESIRFHTPERLEIGELVFDIGVGMLWADFRERKEVSV